MEWKKEQLHIVLCCIVLNKDNSSPETRKSKMVDKSRKVPKRMRESGTQVVQVWNPLCENDNFDKHII